MVTVKDRRDPAIFQGKCADASEIEKCFKFMENIATFQKLIPVPPKALILGAQRPDLCDHLGQFAKWTNLTCLSFKDTIGLTDETVTCAPAG
jgi:hypothetical protein